MLTIVHTKYWKRSDATTPPVVMKSAQDWSRDILTVPVHGPMAWRILVQRQMRPDFIVIVGVGGKDPTQMAFAEDDNVIEAFAADRADQSLRMSVLPR